MKLTQETINNQVWKAYDTFRGTIDATQYKDYILTMLFVKYISDVLKEKKEAYTQQYKGDEVRIARPMKHERFKVPENSTFDYLYEKRNDAELGGIINVALEEIEDTNRSKLEGVFRNIDFHSEPNLGPTKDRLSLGTRILKSKHYEYLQPASLTAAF